jgi:hypothetical protein
MPIPWLLFALLAKLMQVPKFSDEENGKLIEVLRSALRRLREVCEWDEYELAELQ